MLKARAAEDRFAGTQPEIHLGYERNFCQAKYNTAHKRAEVQNSI